MHKLLLSILLICLSYGDDWPQWRGAKGDGISLEKNILKTWPNQGPKKLWDFSLGEGFSGVSISQSMAITMYGDLPGGPKKKKPETPTAKKMHNGYNFDIPIEQQEQNKYEYVVAINVNTGKLIWKTKINELYYNQMGNGPRATPTIDNNRVYTVSGQGYLSCLSLEDGHKIWQKKLFLDFQSDNLLFGISSSPIIYNNWLIYQVGKGKNAIVAFDKMSGNVVWQMSGKGPSYATPIHANIFNKSQLIFFNRDGLVSIDPQTQKYIWHYPWTTFEQIHASTPIVKDNYIFISSGYQTGAAVIELQEKEGVILPKLLWKTPRMKNHFSSSVLLGDYIYGFHNRILKCMNFYTGKEKWQTRGFAKGSIIAIPEQLIVLGEGGNLALIEASTEKYSLKAEFKPFAKKTVCWTIPSIANGKLFIRNKTSLICFSLQE
ncbi:PQQ-binding-like beta-propeller repeat protein [Candidatus Uabimicrobium sp. HlEnr_7]|uniref:PQQ-binding-like beta-propeller repeat protein n=1 Tax=Candidatus Uabimicrobium helgolandensis TaxID=3095367 RepID=UPI003558C870